MNKLIIVGNGFDLAHGLPTSYKSFIDYVWSNIIDNINDPLYSRLVYLNDDYFHLFKNKNIKNFGEFQHTLLSGQNQNSYYGFKMDLSINNSFRILHSNHINSETLVFKFNNGFFERITREHSYNWVDIENQYYDTLVNIAKENYKTSYRSNVETLNNEFNQIKNLLHHYLNEVVETQINQHDEKCVNDSIIDLFEYKHKKLNFSENLSYLLEFSPENHQKVKDFDRLFDGRHIVTGETHLFENLFLNFNYTSNISNYIKKIESKKSKSFGKLSHIQIHGNLTDSDNQINFGFGDEMDGHYKLLEEKNDNNYLENIKSFMYLNNSNYKKLLNWIAANDFQVYIMGHSCGLSDRTLLNTIFEHDHCLSIKIFYYKKDGGDNFKELSQNISRHFNKKTLMRKKVVDKSLCTELPQLSKK